MMKKRQIPPKPALTAMKTKPAPKIMQDETASAAVAETEKKSKEKTRSGRIWELDFFRGLAILLVVFDHLFYDLAYAFGDLWGGSGVPFMETLHEIGVGYMTSDIRFFWRPAFLFVFFFTSGLCTAFSRNNWMRAVRLGIVSCAVTVLTYILDAYIVDGTFVLFTVLHCMTVIIFLYSLTSLLTQLILHGIQKLRKKPFSEKVFQYTLSFLCICLSVAFFLINLRFNVRLVDVSADYAVVETNSKLTGLFFYARNWWTSDYFPLFPYIAFFFLGAGLTQLLYAKRRSLLPFLDGVWHQPFTVAGRHSLTIFVSIQIVAFCLLSLLSFIFLGTFL